MEQAKYEKLKNRINEYNNKDLYIRMDGSLRISTFSIHNAQCVISRNRLLIAKSEVDSTDEEIEIVIDDIVNVISNKEIVLQMNGNYSVYIST